jgi:cysteinyl-tRNA synthetase
MRRYLFADFLRRSLELLGYEVREITNITDVGHLTQDEIDAGEDKLAREANEQKTTPQDIAQRETERFFEDLKLLNIQPSHKYPRATQHIDDMQNMIAELIKREHAYVTPTGIYYDVHSFPAYGKLSGNSVEQLEAGKRIEVREEKKHPADFALWIFDKTALQKWDSPWGVGYPGWHIECSAMSLRYLGTDIDIHTGGIDNKFPHHENEIAQSEGATNEHFVRMWLHNAHLQLDGKKLAKREGEQVTLDTIVERGFSSLAFRLFVFGTHYRTRTDFTWEGLAGAAENLKSIENLLRRLPSKAEHVAPSVEAKEFADFLADDLNTPGALAVLLSYIRKINSALDAGTLSKQEDIDEVWATLTLMDKVLGVIEPLHNQIASEEIPAEVKELAEQREQARRNKKFEEADRLRIEAEAKGYTIEDTSAGPRIVKK